MNVVRFLREVRQEVSKVTWPKRGEVLATTAMVFIMGTFFALLFFLADQLYFTLINLLLGR